MANRSFKSVNAIQQDVIIFASKATLGAGTTVTLANGMGASAAYAGAVLTVTMDDKYNALLGLSAVVQNPAGGSGTPTHLISYTEAVSTTGVIALTFNDDISEDDVFSVMFVLKNSSVTP
tara:strand:+ start:738 stop:1097 length:360 start_codon:yes stop_codon:yes gene_type:complete